MMNYVKYRIVETTYSQPVNLCTVRAPVEASHSELEDMFSHGKCDFLSVDSQHAACSEDGLVACCAIAEELDIPVHFRILHSRHTEFGWSLP